MINYQTGDIIKGKISGFEDYGIFLNFENGYTGLIHISELSQYFVKDVHEYGSLGEEVTCRILEVDNVNKKIKCSIKDTDYGKEKDFNIDHGFTPLKIQLPIWMKEKLDQMNGKR